MIVNERITGYLHSLDQGNGELLDEIERKARAEQVPIIRKETAALLKTLVVSKQPKAILEVGTAVGYSALIMSQVMPADCRITTIEKYPPRIKEAQKNFCLAGEENRICLMAGDAEEILKGLQGVYDFVFMDGAKGQYLHWLPLILERMSAGGILFSDNVLQDGDLAESRFAVERRDRTIHKRMREYLYTLTHHPQLQSAVVPVGDGVTISVKLY
ncbi:MAG: O-methyltransferase [Lachnoclostridium edouardi]|uniref:O-methyltransferase n=1 Tax=Lachnoclostridium edouardi TaxID=1926283 RepID=UPI0026DBC442|nr:O-methyltransferase [Lachnoclostridium edouardi]MDO4277984.1 O-methyltransferase [Lachnoclostridium edouardi]